MLAVVASMLISYHAPEQAADRLHRLGEQCSSRCRQKWFTDTYLRFSLLGHIQQEFAWIVGFASEADERSGLGQAGPEAT